VHLRPSIQNTWPQLSVCLSCVFSKISSCPQLSPVRSSNNQGARENALSSKGRSARNSAFFTWQQCTARDAFCSCGELQDHRGTGEVLEGSTLLLRPRHPQRGWGDPLSSLEWKRIGLGYVTLQPSTWWIRSVLRQLHGRKNTRESSSHLVAEPKVSILTNKLELGNAKLKYTL
jgi:hypothetical protein